MVSLGTILNLSLSKGVVLYSVILSGDAKQGQPAIAASHCHYHDGKPWTPPHAMLLIQDVQWVKYVKGVFN